jgi:serine/threonine-protein kinase
MSGGIGDPAAADAMALEGVPGVGAIIDAKYEVERLLGVGGMGVVVAARHIQLGQRVAIKFMRGITTEDASAVGRFLREARSVVALSSEHVAKVVDVGTTDTGAPFIVMEYLSGIDLGELLRQYGPMTPTDAVNAILQACEAIAEAHAVGIIHRDLKPANLFVTRRVDGSPLVKVLDFGISKRSDFDAALGRSTLTPSGYLMGSPAYMSPEQVRNPKAVDGRTDIWAMGVILYEVLSGSAPFSGETVGETLARIVSEPPRPIRSIRPEVPDGLAQVISQCLDRALDQRIKTIGELAVKLSPFAPRESALSVERIVRISGGATVNLNATNPVSGGGIGTQTLETGPQWVRSGATPSQFGTSRSAVLLAGAAVGLIISAGAVGIYTLSNRGAARSAAADPRVEATEVPAVNAASPPAAPPAVAPTPPPATTQARVDNLDPVQALPPGVYPDRTPDAGAGSSFPGWAAEDRVGDSRERPKPPIRRPRPTPKPAATPTGDPSLDNLLERRQ